MNLIEKLQELDPESDTDDYLETDIASLMQRINQLKQQEREAQKETRAVGNENRRNEKGNQGKGGNKP
jgi:endo-beta-N-acetylglucosaminidase D